MAHTYHNVPAGTKDDRTNEHDKCLCLHSRKGHPGKDGKRLICRWCPCNEFRLFQTETYVSDYDAGVLAGAESFMGHLLGNAPITLSSTAADAVRAAYAEWKREIEGCTSTP